MPGPMAEDTHVNAMNGDDDTFLFTSESVGEGHPGM